MQIQSDTIGATESPADSIHNIGGTSRQIPCLPYYRRCKDYRRCPICAEGKRNEAGERIAQRISDDYNYFHVILSVPLATASVDRRRSQIVEDFNRLRKRHAWKRQIRGGVRAVETKLTGSGEFNVHLHILAEAQGETVDASRIEREWFPLTGGTVETKAVDTDAYRRNVARYVAKPPQGSYRDDDSLWSDSDALRTFLNATKGKRSKTCFGSWYGYALYERRGKGKAVAVGNGDADASTAADAKGEGSAMGPVPSADAIDRLEDVAGYDRLTYWQSQSPIGPNATPTPLTAMEVVAGYDGFRLLRTAYADDNPWVLPAKTESFNRTEDVALCNCLSFPRPSDDDDDDPWVPAGDSTYPLHTEGSLYTVEFS